MPSQYEQFDRSRLRLLPLQQRQHDVSVGDLLSLDAAVAFDAPALPALARAIREAHQRGAAVALLIGAHVIKRGLSRYIIDWIRRGWVSLVAGNGACTVHDFELARVGGTSESVARYISEGQFGLWQETGELNDVIRRGHADRLGFGEAVGRHIAQADLPHRDASIYAAAWEAGVPATVHLGIGYDIIHAHPNFDGAAAGATSYRDFLIFARTIENLEGGVVLSFGSAVMGPEVYLKALSMARNVAHQQGRQICHFTSAVFDLLRLSGDLTSEAPKDSPEYYYRPYKTILVRTVRDGGQSHYVRGDHRQTIPALHRHLAGEIEDPNSDR